MDEFSGFNNIDGLESRIRKEVDLLEPESYYSIDLPQVDEDFMRLDVYSPADYDVEAPESSTVATAVYRATDDKEIEWEENSISDDAYSLWIHDPENQENETAVDRALG